MNLRSLKRLQRSVILLMACALILVLSGCCGACGDAAESFKKFKKASEEQADNSDNSDDPEPTPSDEDTPREDPTGPKAEQDPTPAKPNAPITPRTVDELAGSDLQATVQQNGWKLIEDPQVTKEPYTSTLLTIIKPPMGGAVGLYEYKIKTQAKSFEKGMKDQGAAVVRSGKKVLTVHIPNHPEEANVLLNAILGQ